MQKAKIDLVLNKYARINSDLQTNFRKELDASMKAFNKELDANLTKDQRARLKEMDEKRQEMIRQNRRNRENDTLNDRDGRRRGPDGRPPSQGGPSPPPGPGSSRDSSGFSEGK